MDKTKMRLMVFFSGSVQGVGFRYATERIARKFPVTGYVRNLSNGGVELVAEGDRKSVEEFLSAVRESFHGYIHDVKTSWSEATDEFKGFGIKF